MGPGICLAVLNPGIEVTMVDTIGGSGLAKENARANGVNNVRIFESDGFAAVSGSFHYRQQSSHQGREKVIYPLFEQSCEYLDAGGSLWLVIQKKQGAASAVAKLESIFANCSVEDKSGGYWLLRSIKTPAK